MDRERTPNRAVQARHGKIGGGKVTGLAPASGRGLQRRAGESRPVSFKSPGPEVPTHPFVEGPPPGPRVVCYNVGSMSRQAERLSACRTATSTSLGHTRAVPLVRMLYGSVINSSATCWGELMKHQEGASSHPRRPGPCSFRLKDVAVRQAGTKRASWSVAFATPTTPSALRPGRCLVIYLLAVRSPR